MVARNAKGVGENEVSCRIQGIGECNCTTSISNPRKKVSRRVQSISGSSCERKKGSCSCFHTGTTSRGFTVLNSYTQPNPDIAHSTDKHNCSAFRIFCKKYTDSPIDDELFSCFIDAGIQINASFDNHITVLHENVDNPNVIRRLLSSGASVDAVDTVGRTPIFYAIGYRHAISVELLLEVR